MMGVINITPNSFSDGGQFQGYQQVLDQITYLRNHGVSCFDFGAESTAPFNKAIDLKEESDRLVPILERLLEEKVFLNHEVISIDTYKFELFKKCFKLIRKYNSSIDIIWNDISGKTEDEVLDFLSKNDFKLVVSHNLCPSRVESSSHMDFTSEHVDLIKYFQDVKSKLSEFEILDKVYFDPCFGFSKTLKQNLELIESIESWLDPDISWLLGISRKSFLQSFFSDIERPNRAQKSEYLHTLILSKWFSQIRETDVLIRLHDPLVFKSAQLVN